MRKLFAVIGLGRFGGSLVEEFHHLGFEVLAVDVNEERVNRYSKFATHAVVANAISESNLKSLGLKNFDLVIVSFGGNIEASILTTLLLKDLGVKQVWVKALSENHQKVLVKIGADRVIHPEREMAKRIAHHVTSDKIIDFIELSKNHSIAEIVSTKKVTDKTLNELNVSANYGCTIIGIQRGEEFIVSPSAEEVICTDDILIVLGNNNEIHAFEDKGV
ncbi:MULTISPECIES: potassium channel family protein [Mesobacillus]|uniref:TrkA family potassium uptake protein n=1 Tax=Mesobacillus selenatarsenatis TaxID=388741 RepID=A0A846T5Z2_9BACI|nr:MULTISPECIES: TrkA family potassium uptake protein [Mesobacillus]NKE04063.1 TrkA family potassium uptake protein [Mesobacillus selenatarsenatis]